MRGLTLVRSKSLATTLSHFGAVTALKWDSFLLSAVSALLGGAVTPLHRSSAGIIPTTRRVVPLHMIPRAVGGQRLVPDRTPQPPRGHNCPGGCGGQLHGICGEVENLATNSDNPVHRMCATCLTTKEAGLPTRRTRGRGSATRRTHAAVRLDMYIALYSCT